MKFAFTTQRFYHHAQDLDCHVLFGTLHVSRRQVDPYSFFTFDGIVTLPSGALEDLIEFRGVGSCVSSSNWFEARVCHALFVKA